MGLKSERTTINGIGYEVTQLPYKLGRPLLMKLYKVAGPTIAKALANAPDIAKDTDLGSLNVRDIAPALAGLLEGLAENLSDEDLDYAAETLAKYSKISKVGDKWLPLKQEMEFHFSGNYLEFFQWIKFALKVNYGGFLGEQGVLSGALAQLAIVKAYQSPSTSTGTCTGSPAQENTAAPSER